VPSGRLSTAGPRTSREGASYDQHRLMDEVLATAASGRMRTESALRLIAAIRMGAKNGHIWWKRTTWAKYWHVHESTITRDYELWTTLGFVKRRRNPFKASASLLIFPWSPVWDDEVWTDRERAASLLPELRPKQKKGCIYAIRKGCTDATHPPSHPLYESSKKEISKQQAAADPGTETKMLEPIPAGGRDPGAAAGSRKSLRQPTSSFPSSIDGGATGAIAATTPSSALKGFPAPAGNAELEGTAELKDLLKQYCVSYRPDQVKQLIAAGHAQHLTIAGVIAFVVTKLKDKQNQNDPVHSIRLLIKSINDPADLSRWVRLARRSPSFFEVERGASAATARNFASEVRSYLASCAKQLRQFGGYEEIETELDALVPDENSQVDLESLERRLSALEERTAALVGSRLSVEETSQIQQEINSTLASFRAKMTGKQIDMLAHQRYSYLLFERSGLPRFSLLYIPARRSQAA
jgi:hypothetical protein